MTKHAKFTGYAFLKGVITAGVLDWHHTCQQSNSNICAHTYTNIHFLCKNSHFLYYLLVNEDKPSRILVL